MKTYLVTFIGQDTFSWTGEVHASNMNDLLQKLPTLETAVGNHTIEQFVECTITELK